MTTAQVVEMSVTVNNSPIQDYVQADAQIQPTFELKKVAWSGCKDAHAHKNNELMTKRNLSFTISFFSASVKRVNQANTP